MCRPVYADRPFRAGDALADGVRPGPAPRRTADRLDRGAIGEAALVTERGRDHGPARIRDLERLGDRAALQPRRDEAGTERVAGADRVHDECERDGLAAE